MAAGLSGTQGVQFGLAHHDDADGIVAMGRAMNLEAESYKHVVFDEERTRATLAPIIEAGTCVVARAWVGDDAPILAGFIAGYVVPHFFGQGSTSVELVVYVCPEWRKTRVAMRMIRYWEARSRTLGADGMFLAVSTGGPKAAAIGRLYTSMGFESVGSMHHKLLKSAP
mgnify:CR=1 FL=1